MLLTATVDIRDLGGLLGGPSKPALRAARLAGSSALRAMRAEASRLIRERKAMKLSAVRDALDVLFPSASGELVWALRAKAKPMPVIAFNARQTRRGVSVEINVGKRSLIRGAFIATMKSGHTGVFYRQGKARLPIEEAYTSRISDVLNDVAPEVAKRGVEVFQSTFSRLLG